MPPSPGVDFGVLVTRLRALTPLTETEAKARINQAYRRFARRSQAVRKKVAIGNTANGTNHYAIPSDVLQLFELRVNGLAYELKAATEIDDLNASQAYVVGRSARRFYAPEFTSAGVPEVLIYPTPTTVMPITARAAVMPDDMSNLAAAGAYPLLPTDFHEDLVEGALAISLGRDDERFADRQALLAEFDARAEECRGHLTARRARGVARIRVTR